MRPSVGVAGTVKLARDHEEAVWGTYLRDLLGWVLAGGDGRGGYSSLLSGG